MHRCRSRLLCAGQYSSRRLSNCLLILLSCLLAGILPAVSPPNVIVILSDDQGWGDLSHKGNTNLSTPHIDSLARDGARFDRFFVCSVCAPTRAEFLTGRYHPRGGVRGVSEGLERLNPDERTIADVFKDSGYATGAFGKWHNGSQWPLHPNARGFQEYYGFTSGHWGEYFDPPLEHNGEMVRGKGFIADDLTDRAIDFMEKNKAAGRPFFCYVPYNTPHSPWAVPDEYWQRFKDKDIALRGPDGANEKIEETRCALAMCENLDWNVGRILRRLEDLKLSENTIVLYFSDNGPNTNRWNGGMKGRKGSTDEGGLRSPLVMRWPGRIPGGTVVRDISGAIDLLPTLAALAGVPLGETKPLDGMDLSAILQGAKQQAPVRMLFSHQNGNVSARSQQYRLDNQGALYDMVADPGQKTDVAAEKPEMAAQMKEAVKQWRAEVLGQKNAPEVADAARAQGKAPGPGQGKKGGKKIADDRPYPVGYREFPTTPLPARDGIPLGGVKRSANAPNCSYFVNWTSKEDAMTWNIAVHTTGMYDIEVYYTCPEADAGSTVELEFKGSRLAGKVAPGWDPPLYTNQDTIPRPPGESRMKEFRPLKLGSMKLDAGQGLLTLRAVEIPGKSVMDVRMLRLKLLP